MTPHQVTAWAIEAKEAQARMSAIQRKGVAPVDGMSYKGREPLRDRLFRLMKSLQSEGRSTRDLNEMVGTERKVMLCALYELQKEGLVEPINFSRETFWRVKR